MALQKTGVLVFLVLMVSPAEAQDLLYDPRFCYFLDLFLLIYGIIITGMFLRERCFKTSKQQKDDVYEGLGVGRTTYDKLRQRDVESGQGRRNRREPEDTYTRLQKKTDDTYKEITVKKDRGRNDQVYQGLSAATKDTYDSLHMQPLPPRR